MDSSLDTILQGNIIISPTKYYMVTAGGKDQPLDKNKQPTRPKKELKRSPKIHKSRTP